VNHLLALMNLSDRDPLSSSSLRHSCPKVCFMRMLAINFHLIIEWVKMRLTLVVPRDIQKDTMEVYS
jgi:hypothetical protein